MNECNEFGFRCRQTNNDDKTIDRIAKIAQNIIIDRNVTTFPFQPTKNKKIEGEFGQHNKLFETDKIIGNVG